jgi:hypothetical protein
MRSWLRYACNYSSIWAWQEGFWAGGFYGNVVVPVSGQTRLKNES